MLPDPQELLGFTRIYTSIPLEDILKSNANMANMVEKQFGTQFDLYFDKSPNYASYIGMKFSIEDFNKVEGQCYHAYFTKNNEWDASLNFSQIREAISLSNPKTQLYGSNHNLGIKALAEIILENKDSLWVFKSGEDNKNSDVKIIKINSESDADLIKKLGN